MPLQKNWPDQNLETFPGVVCHCQSLEQARVSQDQVDLASVERALLDQLLGHRPIEKLQICLWYRLD